MTDRSDTPRRGRRPRAAGPTHRAGIRLTVDERARWQAAADRDGLTLSAWIRVVADRAATGDAR